MEYDLLELVSHEILIEDEENHTLYDIIHQVRPKKGQLFSLVTFAVFILVFIFYSQYNMLLALFVAILFLYWYTRSDINIFTKRYKGHESQRIHCFTDAQNLILKRKFDKAKGVLDQYTNKYNDQEAMILYNFVCFTLGEFSLFNTNIHYINEYENDALRLLNGICKILTNQEKEGINELHMVTRVNETLSLVKTYYLALGYLNINEINSCQMLCHDIIHSKTLKVSIIQHAKALLERSKTV